MVMVVGPQNPIISALIGKVATKEPVSAARACQALRSGPLGYVCKPGSSPAHLGDSESRKGFKA